VNTVQMNHCPSIKSYRKNTSRYAKNYPILMVRQSSRRTRIHRVERRPLFTFSPAISFFVDCETPEEVDELWQKLSQGGETQRCGWLKDKHGISWQIIPSALGEMLQDKDDEKSERVMKAMLQMDKIDIRGLKQANDG